MRCRSGPAGKIEVCLDGDRRCIEPVPAEDDRLRRTGLRSLPRLTHRIVISGHFACTLYLKLLSTWYVDCLRGRNAELARPWRRVLCAPLLRCEARACSQPNSENRRWSRFIRHRQPQAPGSSTPMMCSASNPRSRSVVICSRYAAHTAAGIGSHDADSRKALPPIASRIALLEVLHLTKVGDGCPESLRFDLCFVSSVDAPRRWREITRD